MAPFPESLDEIHLKALPPTPLQWPQAPFSGANKSAGLRSVPPRHDNPDRLLKGRCPSRWLRHQRPGRHPPATARLCWPGRCGPIELHWTPRLIAAYACRA